MKFALLSDVHGNSFALQAVLNAVKKKNIDTLIMTGDFVGYYFWPAEVFALLKGFNLIAICGNHDKMLHKAKDDKAYLAKIGKKYGSGLRIALEQLDEKEMSWLASLQETLEYGTKDGKILLCHGSPWDEDEYIYPDSSYDSLNRYRSLGVRWVIQGHTHYPMCKKIGDIMVINPGSVGQPRNGQPGAQWALLDTASGKVKHFCEQYDLSIVVEESKKRHPEILYLADILDRR
jgi:putative phosphoesterase